MRKGTGLCMPARFSSIVAGMATGRPNEPEAREQYRRLFPTVRMAVQQLVPWPSELRLLSSLRRKISWTSICRSVDAGPASPSQLLTRAVMCAAALAHHVIHNAPDVPDCLWSSDNR